MKLVSFRDFLKALSCLLSELNGFLSRMGWKFNSEKITTEHMDWGGKITCFPADNGSFCHMLTQGMGQKLPSCLLGDWLGRVVTIGTQ